MSASAGAGTGGTGGTGTGTAAVPVPEVWKTTPYSGDFNPGTKHGNTIFTEKTKGLPEASRLDLTKKNSQAIHKYFRGQEMLMGDVVRKVPIEYNPDGSIKTTRNLISQYQQISLENCQRAAIARYDNALGAGVAIPDPPFTMKDLDPGSNANDKIQFYKKVHSSVTAHIVKNGLSIAGYDDLLLQKDKFSYHNSTTGEIEFDGPTMIYLIFQKTDPSTVVGLDSHLKKIESAKLGNHSNCIDTMLMMIESHYTVLYDNKDVPKNYRRLLIEALSTGPNHLFNAFIQRVKDDIEAGIGSYSDITPDQIIIASRTKYNNMSDDGTWTKVDPRDAQIMALSTMVENMKKEQKGGNPPQGNNGNGGGTALTTSAQEAFKNKTTNDQYLDGVDRWRIKKGEESKEVKGRTYYWCPHHVKDGKWNGMYVTHKPEDHRGKKLGSDTAAATQAKPASNLELQSKLKEVMCTNLCMSADDVEKLFAQATAEN